MSRPVDPKTLHDLEADAREIAHAIDGALNTAATVRRGFALLIFSFDGPELTWISNANRADMVRALEEFLARVTAGTADELSRPKGRG